ncbi:hypothetical protein [uncultured Alistipes sp.]|jgi:hypothetical protein|uniref:hypothetical protein n=1 Tax=uncultured Alistipes sp. TaxID=538949 RepID=UPI0025E728A5|nr:hypothetical protein [uncultured Alistipes sp.]
MKKLPLLFLVGLLAAGCVDKEYDLKDVETDNIAIGDSQSEFRCPLMTIRVSMQEITDNGIDIENVFRETDIWLPTELPDAYVDIRRLVSDEAYVSTLLDLLVDELLVSDTKLDQVVELIWNTPAYRQSVTGSVPELDLDDADTFRSLFRSLYQNNAQVRELLDEQVRLLAHDYLTALQVDDITYDIDRIDLDDNIVDMLAENLDPEGTPDAKNTLHIYGTIANRLPLSAEIQARLRPTLIEVPVQIDAKSEENVIAETPIYGEDLRTLIHGCQVVIPVTLDRYYRNGFDNTADCQLLIELHLVKRGGLKLNL